MENDVPLWSEDRRQRATEVDKAHALTGDERSANITKSNHNKRRHKRASASTTITITTTTTPISSISTATISAPPIAPFTIKLPVSEQNSGDCNNDKIINEGSLEAMNALNLDSTKGTFATASANRSAVAVTKLKHKEKNTMKSQVEIEQENLIKTLQQRILELEARNSDLEQQLLIQKEEKSTHHVLISPQQEPIQRKQFDIQQQDKKAVQVENRNNEEDSASSSSPLNVPRTPSPPFVLSSDRTDGAVLAAGEDFKLLFEATPAPYMVLGLNSPKFTIIAANDAYLRATLTKRDMVGQGMFEVFPDPPEDDDATGVGNLRSSLFRAISTRKPDAMAVQKYNVKDPETGRYVEKYWTPINIPVFDSNNKMICILHKAEDVTDFMRLKEQGLQQALQSQAETITHIKIVEEEQQRYHRLTALLPIGIFHTTHTGELSYVNHIWQTFTNLAWSEVSNTSRKWNECLPYHLQKEAYEMWSKNFTHAAFRFEYSSQANWYVLHLIPEIVSKSENPKGYLGYIIDITQRKVAEETQRARAENLAELDRAKTVFFSNISHELRTPLTLILGPAEDSLDEKGRQALPPRQRERMEVIQRSAQRLLKLVNSSLDFTRLAEGRLPASFEPTDLAQFTTVLAQLFQPAMQKAGLTFSLDLQPVGVIYVDLDLWQKIVFNLLSNALKYTFNGTVKLMMCLEQEGSTMRMSVQDTGIGIPTSELPHMFERFHRVNHSDGRSHEGAGIGLSLCQELVKLHGGKLELSSELGRGSVFSVCLPVGRNHLPKMLVKDTLRSSPATVNMSNNLFVKEALTWVTNPVCDHEDSDSSVSSSVNSRGSSVSPRRECDSASPGLSPSGTPLYTSFPALSSNSSYVSANSANSTTSSTHSANNNHSQSVTSFVHMPAVSLPPPSLSCAQPSSSTNASSYASSNHSPRAMKEFRILIAEDNADMRKLLRHLLSRDFTVRAVNDGLVAWECAKSERFDLVISDLMMPKMDGYQLIKALRSDEKTVYLPVILLSARVDEESRLRGLHYGADDYVTKPFSKRELLERVGGRLRVGRWRNQVTKDLQEFSDESQRQKRLMQLITHELRNPLVGIKGNSELIEGLLGSVEKSLQERDPDSLLPKISESLAAIRVVCQCCDYQKIICDDVLDLAKLKEQKMELHLSEFDPVQVARDSVQMLTVRAQQGEIELNCECKMKSRVVSGDATRLTQVLVNLLSNAIKFTPKKGSVTLILDSPSETAEKIQLVFSVKDTGMGMSEDQQSRIFSPFVQASSAISSQYGGTGLGLSISKSLVELMEGNISVESTLGQGSTFTATVYCGNVLVAASPIQFSGRLSHSVGEVGGDNSNSSNKGDSPAKRLQILVADDTIINQKILKRMLENAGHYCVVANNGQEALNLWTQMDQVDTILMDLNMPIMGGLEATQRIRQAERSKPHCRFTRIIGLSGDNASDVDWKECGMNDYVVKPYNQRDLLEKIAQTTELSSSA